MFFCFLGVFFKWHLRQNIKRLFVLSVKGNQGIQILIFQNVWQAQLENNVRVIFLKQNGECTTFKTVIYAQVYIPVNRKHASELSGNAQTHMNNRWLTSVRFITFPPYVSNDYRLGKKKKR